MQTGKLNTPGTKGCFVMEIDPLYRDVILARWEQFPGRKPEGVRGQEADCGNDLRLAQQESEA